MHSKVDSVCSLGLVALAALALSGFFRAANTRFPGEEIDERRHGVARARARRLLVWALTPVVRVLVRAEVPASAVTAASLVVSVGAALSLALGHFGLGAVFITLASLGDAVDGLVARQTLTTSPVGALFDATADRYEEFFALGGIAVFVRGDALLLVLALLALAGCFMVSYGSAKAEAYGVEVPGGLLRRAERAACLALATTLVPFAAWAVDREGLEGGVARWLSLGPVALMLALFALLTNASAASRLVRIAEAVSHENRLPREAPRRESRAPSRAPRPPLRAEEAEPHPAE